MTTAPTFEQFADAQARLDDGEDGYTHEQQAADERLTDLYDRLVLQPAAWLRMVEDAQAEFDYHYPEPADETVIEWERGDAWWAARRQDVPEHEGGSWWVYGRAERYTWRQLVAEFEIHMDGLEYLVPKEQGA